MHPTSVAWIVPDGASGAGPMPAQLRAMGYRVQLSAPAARIDADVRVLPADLYSDPSRLRETYERSTLPTLIVAGAADQEAWILDLLTETSDVLVRPGTARLLAIRIDRLLSHVRNFSAGAGSGGARGAIGALALEPPRRSANEDSLTHLYNRRYFDGKLAREIERAERSDTRLAMAVIDFDGLDHINRVFGAPTGDRVLHRIAELASGCVRSLDWMARIGGDEFCLVMPDTHLEAAVQVAERIRGVVASAQIQSLDGRPVPVSVTIGTVSWSPVDGPVGLLQKGIGAVVAAKRAVRERATG